MSVLFEYTRIAEGSKDAGRPWCCGDYMSAIPVKSAISASSRIIWLGMTRATVYA
jgi:hypothetical protein